MKSKADAPRERDMESLLSVEPERKQMVSDDEIRSWKKMIIPGVILGILALALLLGAGFMGW